MSSETIRNLSGVTIDLDRAVDAMDATALTSTYALPPSEWADGDVQAWFTAYEREHARIYGPWPVSESTPIYPH